MICGYLPVLLFVPYRTTTPLYYFPWCTIALIVINIGVFAVCWSDDVDGEEIVKFMLVYGELNPVQWVTSNFIHGDPFHLISNLVFLWIFGQIVEGRLGWGRFLLIYLGIGAAQCAAEQSVMLGADEGGSLGASAVLYGLMAMSLLFAPRYEIRVFYFLLMFVIVRFGTFSVSTIVLAVVYLLLDGFWAVVMPSGSEVLHLSGAALGLLVGYVLLRMGLDCDGDDWFSLRRDSKTREAERAARREAREASEGGHESDEDYGPWEVVDEDADDLVVDDDDLLLDGLGERTTLLADMRTKLEEGDAQEAFRLFQKAVKETGPVVLSDDEFRRMRDGLIKRRSWSEVKALLEDSNAGPSEGTDSRKLLLCRILVEVDKDLVRGRRLLETLQPDALSASEEQARRKLLRKCRL